MAPLSVPSLLFFFVTTYFLVDGARSASTVCPLESDMFLCNLQNQCCPWFSPCLPIEVDGNFVDRALTSRHSKIYTCVLFYASWCPFSRCLRPQFDILSSMFPEIEHLAVEQSKVLPSVFSRYGIRSLPSIVMENQTSSVRYRGPKDVLHIAQFYHRTTGFQPIQYVEESKGDQKYIVQSFNWLPANEMVKQEPYLAFAVLFVCLRVVVATLPGLVSGLKAFLLSHLPHLKLEMFCEMSQLFGRALHVSDMRRIWTKLRFCKTRNFHQSAKNARVWASSSLASVSLGESSSSGRTSSC